MPLLSDIQQIHDVRVRGRRRETTTPAGLDDGDLKQVSIPACNYTPVRGFVPHLHFGGSSSDDLIHCSI